MANQMLPGAMLGTLPGGVETMNGAPPPVGWNNAPLVTTNSFAPFPGYRAPSPAWGPGTAPADLVPPGPQQAPAGQGWGAVSGSPALPSIGGQSGYQAPTAEHVPSPMTALEGAHALTWWDPTDWLALLGLA